MKVWSLNKKKQELPAENSERSASPKRWFILWNDIYKKNSRYVQTGLQHGSSQVIAPADSDSVAKLDGPGSDRSTWSCFPSRIIAHEDALILSTLKLFVRSMVVLRTTSFAAWFTDGRAFGNFGFLVICWVFGKSYYICIKCIYKRKYHVIVIRMEEMRIGS